MGYWDENLFKCSGSHGQDGFQVRMCKNKILKKLLLRNQEADDFEIWYTALGTQVLPNLFKWWHWVYLDHFYDMVKFVSLCASAWVKAYIACRYVFSRLLIKLSGLISILARSVYVFKAILSPKSFNVITFSRYFCWKLWKQCNKNNKNAARGVMESPLYMLTPKKIWWCPVFCFKIKMDPLREVDTYKIYSVSF